MWQRVKEGVLVAVMLALLGSAYTAIKGCATDAVSFPDTNGVNPNDVIGPTDGAKPK